MGPWDTQRVSGSFWVVFSLPTPLGNPDFIFLIKKIFFKIQLFIYIYLFFDSLLLYFLIN